jgi:hypothetical protein
MNEETKTFEYEYELLDIPQNVETSSNSKEDEKEKATYGFSVSGEATHGEATHGKQGMYNNTDFNNTYCKYVSMYEKHLKITDALKDFFVNNEIHNRIDLDLFEEILVNVINNNRVKFKDRYFKKTLTEVMDKGISTLEAYNKHLEDFKKAKKVKSRREVNKGFKNEVPQVKTKFHNINESFRNYSPDELKQIIKESQKSKFKRDN